MYSALVIVVGVLLVVLGVALASISRDRRSLVVLPATITGLLCLAFGGGAVVTGSIALLVNLVRLARRLM